MKIIVASDPFGIKLKEAVIIHLQELGHAVTDVGARDSQSKTYYVEAACALCKMLVEEKYDRGILFCGTGAGVSIVANKHKGIYCVPCESAFTAFKAAQINNANVISIGANVVGPGNACKIVDSYLGSSFATGGDKNRAAFLSGLLKQLYEEEEKQMK